MDSLRKSEEIPFRRSEKEWHNLGSSSARRKANLSRAIQSTLQSIRKVKTTVE